jgi:HK97 family phage prohead protease
MDEAIEFKAVPIEFKATGDAGQYEGHFSIFGNIDDGGDIIHPGAFEKTIQERGKRVKVFYMHDWTKLIGPAPDVLQEDSIGLYAAGRLTLDSFWGKETWALMKDGALNEGSIGYEAVKFDFEDHGGMMVRNLRENRLYEISPVPLGMNALTQIRAVKAATLAAMKKAIPPKETPKADEGEAWDSAAALRDVEGAKALRMIHAWVDPEGDPDAKASYKLPHHLPDGKVVWKGVAAAGAALMGSRGGVDIPDADVAGVQKHLALHYKQFDQTPPWEKGASLDSYLETLALITDELKSGRVLSTANKDKVRGAIDAMQAAIEALTEVMAAAEPQKVVHSALLVKRLRAAELALAQMQ